MNFQPTRCAICGTLGNAVELYPETCDESDFNSGTFSARRTPDRVHYRIVECGACGLVRSDPVADCGVVASLYRRSAFSYSGEVAHIRRTYSKYLVRIGGLGAERGSLLDVGCGSGFVLDEARRLGYADVRGVEPSATAVAAAVPGFRDCIACSDFRRGMFDRDSFDVVCMFQVLDHLADPAGAIAEVHRILKPGGFVLILNHDVDALSARLLGERSPIFDIEHTYLYSRRTLARLAWNQGLTEVESGTVLDCYPLRYMLRMCPLPPPLKCVASAVLERTRIGGLRAALPLGNLYFIGVKPKAHFN